MGLFLFAFFIIGCYVFSRAITQGAENIGKEVEDVWIDSLPTIAPGDENPNPIKKRMGQHGQIEYYRNARW